jgi:penicillin-binding protein 1A
LLLYRTALAQSRNIPALRVFQTVDPNKIKEFTTNLGLHPEIYMHEAHCIGSYGGIGTKTADGKIAGENPLSMSAAYAAFGNGGQYNEPYSFTKIIYNENNEIYEPKFIKRQAMSPETAYIINNMLIRTTI